ncbi:hypothetical protein ZWY2020_031008 [Hordeum vulgare]|nr:hypothetical protein ZWY2020_031008 [Hordeum vulgare]
MRTYLGVLQRRWGTWMAKITGRETHTRWWLGIVHTAKLATMGYDRRQVRYHGAVHLVPSEPGVVSSAMEWEDREAREGLEAEAIDEAYMQELRPQYPEVVEADRMIFADADGEVIVISPHDEVEGGDAQEIDVNEWRSVFPDDEYDDTGSDPNRGTSYLTRKDWLDITFNRKLFS